MDRQEIKAEVLLSFLGVNEYTNLKSRKNQVVSIKTTTHATDGATYEHDIEFIIEKSYNRSKKEVSISRVIVLRSKLTRNGKVPPFSISIKEMEDYIDF